MVYLRNEPVASDFIAVSQPKLQANTNDADTYFAVDHQGFSAASNQGKHNQVTLLERAAASTPGVNEGALYGLDVSGNTELHYRLQSSGTITQMTTAGALCLTNSTIPMGVRASGRFTLGATPALVGTAFNVTAPNITRPDTGQFNIQLTNALTDTNALVFFSVGSTAGGVPTNWTFFYTITDTSNILFKAFGGDPRAAFNFTSATDISFMVIR